MNVLAYLWQQVQGFVGMMFLIFLGAMVLVAIAVIGEAIGGLFRWIKHNLFRRIF